MYFNFDFKNILLLIVAFLSSFYGFIIYFRHKSKREIIVDFFWVILSVFVWILAMFLFRASRVEEFAYIWAYILYATATIIPYTFLNFTLNFVGFKITKIQRVLMAIPLASVIIISLMPNALIKEVNILLPNSENEIIFDGILYLFYSLYLFVYFTFSYLLLFREFLLSSEKKKKMQILFLFLGTFVATTIGMITNLILPYYGVFQFNWMGQVSVIIMILSIYYATIKYNLFNIKIILTEIFIILLWSVLLIRLFLSETAKGFLLELLILTSTILLGIFLIRSMHKEVKRREEAEYIALKLQLANERLRELDRAKTDFISIASHQLRTPLTAIKGYASMILEGSYGEVPTKIRGVLDRIYRSSQRLVFLVNDLLNVSRMEQGRMKYEEEDIRIVNLVKEIYDELKVNADTKKLKFSFFVDPDDADIIVRGDYGKLRQAITNIVDNSIKYTDVGYVLISLKKDETKKYALITIRDSGIGIDPKKLNTIFEKFERAEDAIKTHTEGSGLGLFVAKEIIKHHKGEIWADSKGKGQGAIFYIKLPIYKEL